jgi:hypothetical protein
MIQESFQSTILYEREVILDREFTQVNADGWDRHDELSHTFTLLDWLTTEMFASWEMNETFWRPTVE